MEFRIADTFTDSLARLTGDEQKAVKMTAFDLQLNPANPGMSFHKLDKAKDKIMMGALLGPNPWRISQVAIAPLERHASVYVIRRHAPDSSRSERNAESGRSCVARSKYSISEGRPGEYGMPQVR